MHGAPTARGRGRMYATRFRDVYLGKTGWVCAQPVLRSARDRCFVALSMTRRG